MGVEKDVQHVAILQTSAVISNIKSSKTRSKDLIAVSAYKFKFSTIKIRKQNEYNGEKKEKEIV